MHSLHLCIHLKRAFREKFKPISELISRYDLHCPCSRIIFKEELMVDGILVNDKRFSVRWLLILPKLCRFLEFLMDVKGEDRGK